MPKERPKIILYPARAPFPPPIISRVHPNAKTLITFTSTPHPQTIKNFKRYILKMIKQRCPERLSI
jgi:hypothetical protein